MCDEIKNNKFSATLFKLIEAEEEVKIVWKKVREDMIKCIGVENIILKIIDICFDNFIQMVTALRIYHDDDGKWFMKCGDEIESIPIYEGFELNIEHFIYEQAYNMLQRKFNRPFFMIDQVLINFYENMGNKKADLV